MFVIGNDTLSDRIDFTADMKILGLTNVEGYDVYINGNYYGTNIPVIQITDRDILEITITKIDDTKDSIIHIDNQLV